MAVGATSALLLKSLNWLRQSALKEWPPAWDFLWSRMEEPHDRIHGLEMLLGNTLQSQN